VVQEVQVARPADWRLRPNGWLSLTDEQATSVLGAAGPGGTGQGREDDPAVRRAVELRAMAVAREWLTAERGIAAGDIRDTSRNRPYDLAVGPEGAEVLHIEVKGMRGRLGPVTVTSGEVESARNRDVPTLLVVVSAISVDLTHKPFTGEGGAVNVVDPWRPTKGQLEPTVFRYAVPL
jgi:hypothetical protein